VRKSTKHLLVKSIHDIVRRMSAAFAVSLREAAGWFGA
jgi:hypothetical protein